MSVVALKDEHRSWSGNIIFSDDEGSIIDHIGETVEAVLEVQPGQTSIYFRGVQE